MKILIYANIPDCKPILKLEIKAQEVIIPALMLLEALAHCKYCFELVDDNCLLLVGKLNIKSIRDNIFKELVKEFAQC